MTPPPSGTVVFTVGHSNRALGELLQMVRAAGAPLLVDVRRYPRSRRHPHFSREPLAGALAAAGIAYRHEEDLGGHREPRADSPHTAWSEDAFRGYADHMESAAFQAALLRVLEGPPNAVVMCAEADPLHCHRQLLADALLARGARVVHLLGGDGRSVHVLHPRALVGPGGRVAYPAPPPKQRALFGS